MKRRERVLGALWGSLIGDALGVPVEFKDRATLQADPVTDMRGFGTHHQPAGTWSDDGALLLCTVDILSTGGFDLEDLGQHFVRWMNEGLWTARGDVFDVGMVTSDALARIQHGTPPEQAGGKGEYDNGNGSLMRILPVALRFSTSPVSELIDYVERASAITHAHPRSKMACALHALTVRQILSGANPLQAVQDARAEFLAHYAATDELRAFERLLKNDLSALPEHNVVSTGYVLHTLHASLWCLCNATDFETCVLKAVNLGGDSDTTGCVAGGLAGAHSGLSAIPQRWHDCLPRTAEITHLFERFVDLIEH